jgi:hypothetical protein
MVLLYETVEVLSETIKIRMTGDDRAAFAAVALDKLKSTALAAAFAALASPAFADTQTFGGGRSLNDVIQKALKACGK